jgi:hypothetical protein
VVIGVLCARVRVEEKQIIGAFGDAGAVAMPVLPASTPLPPGPARRSSAPAGETTDASDPNLSLIVDRCADRYVAEAILPLLQARGVRVIGAGLASFGSRLQVASALERAGLARPSTLLAFDEDSANLAVRQIGVPASLIALNAGKTPTPMLDLDTADAVVEHRMVLAGDAHAVVLVQAGAPDESEITTVHVLGGEAIAFSGAEPDAEALTLATRSAKALDAEIAAVQIAQVSGQQVVWDVLPVADFRQSTPLGELSVAQAIARIALGTAETEVLNGVNLAINN